MKYNYFCYYIAFIFLLNYSGFIYSMEQGTQEQLEQHDQDIKSKSYEECESAWDYIIHKSENTQIKKIGREYEYKETTYSVWVGALALVWQTSDFKDKPIDHVRFDSRIFGLIDNLFGFFKEKTYFQLHNEGKSSGYPFKPHKEQLDFLLKISPKMQIWRSNKGDYCSISIDTTEYDDYRFSKMSWPNRHPYLLTSLGILATYGICHWWFKR